MFRTFSIIFFFASAVLLASSLFSQSENLDQRAAIEDGLQRARAQVELTQEQEQFLRIQLAIIDFTVTRKQPPQTIAELVPDYFDSMPHNPNTGAPYIYKKEGSRYFVLGDSTSGQLAALRFSLAEMTS